MGSEGDGNMEYSLHQRGRAAIDFLVDLRQQSNRLENSSDQYAQDMGIVSSNLPRDPDELQQRITPVMQECLDFRMLRMMREWQLDQHGWIAIDAFEEIRDEVEPALQALQVGPTTITHADNLKAPAYWDGYEFHRSAGGWDGHDYMGFVHGELIHHRMIGTTFTGAIYEERKNVAGMAPNPNPEKILEMGCASGQFTTALAKTYPASEIWACDLSRRQLEQAQRRANEMGAHWHLLEAAAEATGLPDEYFDLIASYAIFHELPTASAKQVLQETFRLLKPGGYTVVGDVTAYHVQDAYTRWKADFWNQIHGGDPFWREYATTDLAELARDVGFSEANWSGVGESQHPFVLIAKKT
jgi:SAM-dependent methyltransferase